MAQELETTIATDEGPMTLFAAWSETRGSLPGVIIYMDIFGLRDEIFDFARRFANQGYAAFVPDLFHRLPVSRFQPANVKGTAVAPEARAAGAATTLDHGIADSLAVLRYADQEAGLSIGKFGAVGYCMGGRHALAAGHSFAARIPAVASIHGGQLVNDTPQSPHRLLESYVGEAYLAFARDDPTCPDDHQHMLETALEDGKATGIARHFDAHHGWSFPTRWAYDPSVDKQVWQDLFALFACRLTPD